MNFYFYRALSAIVLISCMIGVAEWVSQQEIIFPEIAALAIGYWIVDKHVWRVSRTELVFLMTFGAVCGVLIVRYSPFPQEINIPIAFCIAAVSLFLTDTTLMPMISACMLPVLLHTESWIYPTAVFGLSMIVVIFQKQMEKWGWRHSVEHLPHELQHSWKRWAVAALCVTFMSYISIFFCLPFLVLPPLVVCFSEMIFSHADLKNRPLHTFLLMVCAACIGTVSQLVHLYLGIPQFLLAPWIVILLLLMFNYSGKYFAPAGALAMIPLLLPAEHLIWLPLQVTLGCFTFISIALIINFYAQYRSLKIF